MHERANIIGGTVEIDSRIGDGTAIFVRIPHTRRTVGDAEVHARSHAR
jgi:chemotaxis protein histidine kinase CheA